MTAQPLSHLPLRATDLVGDLPNPLLLRRHAPVLDGLRGVAILLVLLMHLMPSGPSTTLLGKFAKSFAEIGSAGVDLFFVLSGFFITGILLNAKGAPHYFRNFYARRVLRIFPLYYGMLLVSLVLIPLIWPPTSPDARRIVHDQGWLWLYVSNIKGSFSALDRPFSAGWMQFDHFWSLALQEQFYLIWPVLILLLNRRWMIWLCTMLIGLALATRCWLYWNGDETAAFYSLTLCRLDELAIGSLLALMGRERLNIARMKNIATIAALTCGVILAAIWNTDARAMTLGGTLFSFLFGALVVLALATAPNNPLRTLLTLQPLCKIGQFSYAIYVLHPMLLAILANFITYQRLGTIVHSGELGVFLYLIIGFALTLAAGWASWHLYEKHFLKLKRFVENPKKAVV